MSDAIKSNAVGGNIDFSTPAEVRPRLWPALVIVAIQWIALLVPRRFAEGEMLVFYGFMIGIYFGMGGVLIWWLFFSRVRWSDVGVGLLAMAIGLAAVALFGDPSLKEMGGFPIIAYVAPLVTTALVVALGVTPFLKWPSRRAVMVLAMLAVCGYYLTQRLDGMNGAFAAAWLPRWQTTDESAFLAKRGKIAAPANGNGEKPGNEPLTVGANDWPAFRGGALRDGVYRGPAIETDWTAYPPKLLWRQLVGPGWGSFAVVGDRVFTQEQRGPDEVVVCYNANTGKELWEHKDPARFSELVAGPGPRATPTFHEGKLYTQGAAGKLNCLDARTGAVIWSRDIVADSGSEIPTWGFSASPLVVDGVVTVYGGAKDKAVLAYDALTGYDLWQRGNGDKSYCSTQLARIDGVDQILISTNTGVVSLEPKSGTVLWNHEWILKAGMARVTQPNVFGSDFLVGTGFGEGTQRVHVERSGDAWKAKDVWTSRAISPYFNDFVVHDNHMYGFDGPFLTCVELTDGKKRKWRERGYGNGQVVLLPKQNLLLVLSEARENEMGCVALVDASPSGFKEVSRIESIEGKTWNHPVIANGRLFVRNGREAACFELKMKAGADQGK